MKLLIIHWNSGGSTEFETSNIIESPKQIEFYVTQYVGQNELYRIVVILENVNYYAIREIKL